ncbi:class F sortase [Streptomyces nojiriensis]|uniref:class F sortase n=1 Tax=Streptomyces nojiriensis TaxID=66374 RepID=UPI003651F00A
MSRAALRATALLAPLALAALTGCGGAPAAAPAPAAPQVTPHVTPASAAPAEAPAAGPMPASEPVRVRIPSAGVDASPVLGLGLAADGTVEVPSVADADKIGWYTKGVTPGQTGPAVLIGHLDTARGPAVLKDVSRVRTGEEITVSRADGSTAVFRVRELEQVGKKEFPTAKVYGDTARPELRVITCGGELTDGHRPDNIILYADLVG